MLHTQMRLHVLLYDIETTPDRKCMLPNLKLGNKSCYPARVSTPIYLLSQVFISFLYAFSNPFSPISTSSIQDLKFFTEFLNSISY